jgi:hypothetical protein
MAGQRSRGLVVAEHRHPKAPDPGRRGPLGELRQEGSPDAAALPAIDHLDRHLGSIEVVEPQVAGDTDRRTRLGREGDQRLMVPVIDAHEPSQLPLRELGLGAEIALIARARAEMSEREGQRPPVEGG